LRDHNTLSCSLLQRCSRPLCTTQTTNPTTTPTAGITPTTGARSRPYPSHRPPHTPHHRQTELAPGQGERVGVGVSDTQQCANHPPTLTRRGNPRACVRDLVRRWFH